MGEGSQKLLDEIANKVLVLEFENAKASHKPDLELIQNYVKKKWTTVQQNGFQYLDKCVKMSIYTGISSATHTTTHRSLLLLQGLCCPSQDA